MNQFQVVGTRIPRIESNISRFDLVAFIRLHKHLPKMIILRFAILIRIINPVINRIKITLKTVRMHQIDQPDAFHQAMNIPALLQFDRFHHLRILLVLD